MQLLAGLTLFGCLAAACVSQAGAQPALSEQAASSPRPAANRASAAPIASRFTAHKVVQGADGKESLEDAANVTVGDTLQYSAHYRNVSTRRLLKVDFGIPIPPGTSYVEGSASPEGARRVKLDKRRDQMQWRVGKLDPGDEAALSLRVKIDPDPTLTPAPVAPHRPELRTR